MRVEIDNHTKQVDDFVIAHKGMEFHIRFGNVYINKIIVLWRVYENYKWKIFRKSKSKSSY